MPSFYTLCHLEIQQFMLNHLKSPLPKVKGQTY